MTRGELLDRIDARELVEWEAYEGVAGPLGSARVDQLFARLMATVANVNRSSKQKPYSVEQFMPNWDPGAPRAPRPQQSPEDQLRAVKSINRRMGGEGGPRRGDAR